MPPPAAATERLPGTHRIRAATDEGFSVSPEGRWLLFRVADGRDAWPSYVLYDLERSAGELVTPSAEASALGAQWDGPLARAGCWDGTRVYLPGNRRLFTSDPLEHPPQWQVVDGPAPELYRRIVACEPPGPRLQLRRNGERRVEVLGPRGEVAAAHEPARAFVTRIDVSIPRVAPDGRHAAYTVSERRGSFVLPATLFVLPLRPTLRAPLAVSAGVVGEPQWSTPGDLFAQVGGGEDTAGIYRWRIGE